MPAFEICDLKQDAVIWMPLGNDRHGLPVVGQPREIKCRWTLSDTQSADPQGNTIQSSGKVTVAADLPPGVIMRQGLICDVPDPPDQLHTVVSVNSTPDIKNRNTRINLTLMRYTDTLPTVLLP